MKLPSLLFLATALAWPPHYLAVKTSAGLEPVYIALTNDLLLVQYGHDGKNFLTVSGGQVEWSWGDLVGEWADSLFTPFVVDDKYKVLNRKFYHCEGPEEKAAKALHWAFADDTALEGCEPVDVYEVYSVNP